MIYGAQTEKQINRIETVVYLIQEIFGINKKVILFFAGTLWNRSKGTPQPETIQKPADFLPGDSELTATRPSTSATITLFDD